MVPRVPAWGAHVQCQVEAIRAQHCDSRDHVDNGQDKVQAVADEETSFRGRLIRDEVVEVCGLSVCDNFLCLQKGNVLFILS